MLENKLGLTSSAELAREEERISKKKAAMLFENHILDNLESGKFSTLQTIHKYLFDEIYDFAGKLRTVNIAKGNFRFAPLMYIESALKNIDEMPQSNFDEIIEKYVEMNIAHPFREGNGRSARIWLDHMLKTEIGKVIDWLHHNKSFYEFGFDEESDGTRRLFDLMDMLLNKREDVLYVVDELERSLHPKLTERFLQLFMQLHDEQRMQLLFTTHESSIMDQAIFRRDEIWFVERNAENASSIYSLDRFKERYDKVLSKAYLEGRYGAIPVFSTFDFREEE